MEQTSDQQADKRRGLGCGFAVAGGGGRGVGNGDRLQTGCVTERKDERR